MKPINLSIEDLKKMPRLNSHMDLVVKHQNDVRKLYHTDSDINDQTDYVSSKKRAIEIATDCLNKGLVYQIQLRNFS